MERNRKSTWNIHQMSRLTKAMMDYNQNRQLLKMLSTDKEDISMGLCKLLYDQSFKELPYEQQLLLSLSDSRNQIIPASVNAERRNIPAFVNTGRRNIPTFVNTERRNIPAFVNDERRNIPAFVNAESRHTEQISMRLHQFLLDRGFKEQQQFRPSFQDVLKPKYRNQNAAASVITGIRHTELDDIHSMAAAYVEKRNIGLHQTPLHLSAEIGDVELVCIFLQAGADVNATDTFKHTPLHLSAQSDCTVTVKILLKAGADVNFTDIFKHTPLHLSAQNGHTETMKILLEAGANVNDRRACNTTPLHLSAEHGQKEAVAILLNSGADVNILDVNNNTPLHLSARGACVDVVKLLLTAKADVNAINKDLETPLHLCVIKGHTQISEILLKAGATVNAQDKMEQTPLHVSAINGYTELSEILLNAGASVEIKDKNGLSFLDYQKDGQNYIERIKSRKTIIESVSTLSTSLNGSSQNSQTTTIEATQTNSETFPSLKSQIIKPGNNTYNKACDDVGRDDEQTLTSETVVCEDEVASSCSNSYTFSTSSTRSSETSDTNLPGLNNIGQQAKDHWATFSPRLDEGWEATCSADVKAAFKDGRVSLPTTVSITNKSKVIYNIHHPNYNISDAQNFVCTGSFILNEQKHMSTEDEYDDSSDSSGNKES